MKKLSAKQRILTFLKGGKDGWNEQREPTVAQLRARFGVQNVAARIEELRNEGHCIYTNTKTLANGRRISYYRIGAPTKRLVRLAISRGFSFSA